MTLNCPRRVIFDGVLALMTSRTQSAIKQIFTNLLISLGLIILLQHFVILLGTALFGNEDTTSFEVTSDITQPSTSTTLQPGYSYGRQHYLFQFACMLNMIIIIITYMYMRHAKYLLSANYIVARVDQLSTSWKFSFHWSFGALNVFRSTWHICPMSSRHNKFNGAPISNTVAQGNLM